MLWYYVLVFIILSCSSVLLVLIPKTRYGLRQKLGLITDTSKPKNESVWFHAVSVGELNAISKLVLLFKESNPKEEIVISTTTKTANDIALNQFGTIATVIYFPFDLPWIINKFLVIFKPKAVIIAETEIWPGFIHEAYKRKIKLIMVNGRISPRSFKNYHFLSYFFKPIISKFNLICVQNDTEKNRFEKLTNSSPDIKVTGNLKYDGVLNHDQAGIDTLAKNLHITHNDFVIVAGSTHDSEEKAIIKVFQRLKSTGDLFKTHNNLKLLIVPRHDERFSQVESLIKETKIDYAKYSDPKNISDKTEIILIDKMGILTQIYALAQIAFIGGSLVKVGGHNLLEPYNYKIPVICGKYLFKTKQIAYELVNLEAISIAENEDELYQAFLTLIQNADKLKRMGERGQSILNNSKGSNQSTLALINNLIYNKITSKIK